jgi:hypothetical protein
MKTLIALLLLTATAAAQVPPSDPHSASSVLHAAFHDDPFGDQSGDTTRMIAQGVLPDPPAAAGKPICTGTAWTTPMKAADPTDPLDSLYQASKTADAALDQTVQQEAAAASAHAAATQARQSAKVISDKAAADFAAEWQKRHGGVTPPPTPPSPPPTPPAPIPVPPPAAKVSLLLISSLPGDGFKCAACDDVATNTIPKLSLGDQLRVIGWSGDEAKRPENRFDARIPRWKLTRGDGTTETFVGKLSAEQVTNWIAGTKP